MKRAKQRKFIHRFTWQERLRLWQTLTNKVMRQLMDNAMLRTGPMLTVRRRK